MAMPPAKRIRLDGADGIPNGDHDTTIDLDRTTKKRINPESSNSLFVKSLPLDLDSDGLAAHFSTSFPLKHAIVVLDPATKLSKGFGFVTFADAADAQKARDEFNGTILGGKNIRVDVAKPRQRGKGEDTDEGEQAPAPTSSTKVPPSQTKLIIRNLPWSVTTTKQLEDLFRPFGKIKAATLPKARAGLAPGFGFVVLRGRKNAEKALASVNGKVLDGRTLAVDWAVDKDSWQAAQTETKEEDKPVDIDDEPEVKTEDEDYDFDDEEEDDEEDEEDKEGMDLDEDDEEDFDDDVSVKSESGDPATAQQSDAYRSRTLFIRNVSFDTTDETLKAHFAKFYPINYARIVIDPETGRPRGTGFVCFALESDARDCVRQKPHETAAPSSKDKGGNNYSLLQNTLSDPSGKYTLDGRVLQVSPAVTKDDAHRLNVEGDNMRTARDKDKRRLYLLSEGTIPAQSPLYKLLPPSELRLREESAKQRQAMIRNNPTLHLSLTRLSIRNLPRWMDSKQLKALAREAVVEFAKDVKAEKRQRLTKEELSRAGAEMQAAEKSRKQSGKGIVRQAKIVFEGKEGSKVSEDSGAGRSRGYGFIEYVSHKWALMGLRWLNGHLTKPPTGQGQNVNTSGDKAKRLIVEFAIENAQVVARRREREVKARDRARFPNANKTPITAKAGRFDRSNAGKRERPDSDGDGDLQDSSTSAPATKSKDEIQREAQIKRARIIGKKRMQRKTRKQKSG